jgi:dTDP-4-dehydrorhamnose reductase
MARWLVTGSGGMLGRDLTGVLSGFGEQVVGLARSDLDVTDNDAVRAAVQAVRPDVVVNCAAWTRVDDAEANEGSALAINGDAVAGIAAACRDAGVTLIQPSTDYVFDGMASAPYSETAAPAPRTAYGRTKLAGERAVLGTLPDRGYVVRTAWLYGAEGPSFVGTMINLARSGASPAVVDDQRGQPTWTVDVARQMHRLITAGAPAGIYHATSSGETTWFGLARAVFRLVAAASASARPQVSGAEPAMAIPTPTTSAAYRRPAPRPSYSVLSHDAWRLAGIAPITHWTDALQRAFPSLL